MKRVLSEQVAVFEPGSAEDPVLLIDNLPGCTGHGTCWGEDNTEEAGFGFVAKCEAAVAALHAAGFEGLDIAVVDCHGVVVVERDFAVESIAAEVNEFTALVEDPVFDAVIHWAGPVFGVNGDDENFVVIEIECAVVELCFGVVVEGDVFSFEPAEESPFGGGEVAGLSAFDGVTDAFAKVD